MSDLSTLAKRLDAAANPDACFAALAFSLERCQGDLPVAADLAEIVANEVQFAIPLPTEPSAPRFKMPQEGTPEDDAHWEALDAAVHPRGGARSGRTRSQSLWRVQGDPHERARKIGLALTVDAEADPNGEYAHAAMDELQRLHASFNLPQTALNHTHHVGMAGRGAGGWHRAKVVPLPARTVVEPRAAKQHERVPDLGQRYVGKSYEHVVGHEHGHAVHDSLPYWQRALWHAVHRQINPKSISGYAATNHHEAFAEAFSAYTHPNYQRGSLPEPVERFFDTVISKEHSGRLPPQAELTAADHGDAESFEQRRYGMLTGAVAMVPAMITGSAPLTILGGLAGHFGLRFLQRILRRFRGVPDEVQQRIAQHALLAARSKEKDPKRAWKEAMFAFQAEAEQLLPEDRGLMRERGGTNQRGGRKTQVEYLKSNLQHQPPNQFDDDLGGNVDPLPDHIATVGHRAALGAMDAARAAIRDILKKNGLALDDPRLVEQIRDILNEANPPLAQVLAETMLAGLVRGADEVLKLADFPFPSQPPSDLPPPLRLLAPEGEEPIVHFPVLEAAAGRIATAAVLSPDEFYKLGAAAREKAFTITGDMTEESVAKIQEALVENLREGPSALAFGKKVAALFEEGMPLSRAHLEQVFRNNVNGAWSDGHDKALRHEMVADAFPYRAYTATRDQRVRDEHLYLEQTGLDGTNIYLASDPVFQAIRPPWSWNCRCSFYPVSVSQAARKGVEHAKRWLAQAERLRVEPEQTSIEPEYVDWPTLNGQRIAPPPQWQRSSVGV